MAALLAAQTVAVHHHVFVDVLVAHLGLLIADAALVEGLVQTEVAHNGGHHGVAHELPFLFQVLAAEVENMVSGDDLALFVHRQAPVRVAVKGEACVQTVFHHKLLQALNVGGAGIGVDVVAVGLVVDDIGLGAQGIEHGFCNVPGAAVGAVQTDAQALKGVEPQADQIADVPVSAGHIVHRPANLLPFGGGKLLPAAAEALQISVNVALNQGDDGLVHFFAGAVDELDAVVVVGVVAGGDHNAAVEALSADDEGHAGGGGYVQQVGIRAGGHQTAHQAVLKHIAGTAGILADDDSRRIVGTGPALQLAIVPAQETPHLEGVVGSQGYVGFAAEAVSAKVFSHRYPPQSFRLATMLPPVFQMLSGGTTPRTQEVG